MDLVFRYGRMVQSIEACGRTTERTERVLSGMLMETTMKVNSKTINPTATASTHAPTAQCTKEFG